MGKRVKEKGRGSIKTLKMLTASAPTWLDLGTLTWTTGDVISLSLPEYINDTSPEGFTTYSENGSTPNDLSELDLSVSSAGIISGTIGDFKGGTFNFLFDAANLEGTTVSSLTITVVSLEVVAPTFSAVPDALSIEVGEYFLIYFPNSLEDDGDPSGISIITYAESGDNLPPGFTLTSAGLMSGACTGISSQQEVTVVATNDSGFPTDIKFDMSAVDNSAVAPTMTGLWSGEKNCGIVAPTWNTIPDFSWVEDVAISDITLADYINSNGGAAITGYSVDTGTLPTGLSGPTSAGVISGTPTTTGTSAMTFVTTNSVGNSLASNSSDLVITATAAPTITSVTVTNDSDVVYIHFSEAVDSPTSDLEAGLTYLVNTVEKTLAYVSGATTNTLKYTSSVVLTSNNQIDLSYANATGDITGEVTSQEVADLSNLITYVNADIVFQTTFDEDASFSRTNGVQSVDPANVPEGWESSRCQQGSIIGTPGAGVDGSVAMKFNWEGGSSEKVASSLYRHLTGDETTGYPEVFLRFKYRIPNTFRAGGPGQALIFWKWMRLWQNTEVGNPWASESRSDSYFVVGSWGNGMPKWGIRQNLVMSENLGNTGDSFTGERYSTNWYVNGGDDIDHHINHEGHWDHIGDGDLKYYHDIDTPANDTRILADTTTQGWHTIEWRLKLSTTATSNDGIWQLWFDGVEQICPNIPDSVDQAVDQPTTASSLLTAAAPGYNMLVCMDNCWGFPALWDEAGVEGGVYLNDVVVSTSRIGHEYVAQPYTP